MLDSTVPRLPSPAEQLRRRRDLIAIVAATLVVCLILLAWSIGTAPVLGDDSHHFRRAVVYYEALWDHFRAVYDPAYPPEGPASMRCWEAAFWHTGLAVVWKVLGSPSFLVAEAYHLAYFLMLGVFSFLTGRELFGRSGGWWTWALAVTMPINLLLGMLFYLEIPVAAMVVLATYCVVRRWPVWLGVALAGMFYIKVPMAAVLAPPLVLAALLKIGDTWGQRLRRTALALAIGLLLLLPDMLWRIEHFGRPLMLHDNDTVSVFQFPAFAHVMPIRQSAIPLPFSDPLVVLKTFGVTGVAATVASVAWAVWLMARTLADLVRHARSAGPASALRSLPARIPVEVLVGAVPLLYYIVAYIVLLHLSYDVRYFHGAVFFATLLGGGLLARLRPLRYQGPRGRLVRAGGILVLLAMLGQLATAPAAVHEHRILPPTVAAGFAWIAQNVPPKAPIFYVEFNLVTLTGRPILWSAVVPRYLFTAPEEVQAHIFHDLNIQYIAIHPTRFIEKAEPDVDPMGLPIPWVRSLRERPYLTQVYPAEPCRAEEGGEFVVYRIDDDKIPPAWLKTPLYANDVPSGAAPPPASK